MVLRKLGRGLDSLIEDSRSSVRDAEEAESSSLRCDAILPNPYQPRERFDEAAIEELAGSIERHGVLQPIVVRKAGERYEIVAGERRWRACLRLGLERVPAVVREVADDRMLEIALVENLQREDLDPIEKARAYRRYVEELALTHEEAARRLGKDRSTVTNQLRLLDLSLDLQRMVSRGTLSMGHARALLGAATDEQRRKIAARIEKESLSVREAERIVKRSREPSRAPATSPERSAHLSDLERQLRDRFATKARIEGSREKGKITLAYYSMDDLTRLLEMLLPVGEQA